MLCGFVTDSQLTLLIIAYSIDSSLVSQQSVKNTTGSLLNFDMKTYGGIREDIFLGFLIKALHIHPIRTYKYPLLQLQMRYALSSQEREFS